MFFENTEHDSLRSNVSSNTDIILEFLDSNIEMIFFLMGKNILRRFGDPSLMTEFWTLSKKVLLCYQTCNGRVNIDSVFLRPG